MRRGRLARKYLAVLVSLVAGALVVSGAVELRSSYVENKAALVTLQREKAGAAAARIESFVREIERALGWTAQPTTATGRAALEERRLDAIRLLRQAPAVTDVSELDATGHEQVRVSRVERDVLGSGLDLSAEPKFTQARRRTWFGPVYFRKESEPYMTISVPQSGGGVTTAEVNLKFIWDVVSQIRVGKSGLAYAVDGRGELIAHPDISLVLQKTSLAGLPQVRAALGPAGDGDDITIARDVRDRDVLTAHARIPSLGWVVFVEQPSGEAFAPVRASAWRIVLLVLFGIAFSAVASVMLARRLARPIQALQESAARIGAGELDHRISIRTGDELEALADQFNEMTGRLRESYATLEQKVEDRTRELREALEQQTATAEILRVISSSPTDVQPVLDAVAEAAARLCGAHDAVIRRVDGDVLRLWAHHGSIPLPAFAEDVAITSGRAIGRAILERRTIHVPDIAGEQARGEYLDARSVVQEVGYRAVLVTPLLREGAAIGAILIRRMEPQPFTDKQVALLETFAAQAVIAIENVRLFKELEEKNAALAESLEQQTATAEILRSISSSPTDVQPVFETIVRSALRLLNGRTALVQRVVGDQLHLAALTVLTDVADDAVRAGFPVPLSEGGPAWYVVERRRPYVVADTETDPIVSDRIRWTAPLRGYRSMVLVPMLREEHAIGVIAVTRAAQGGFSEDEVALLQTFADQAVIAIENVRLFKELEARNRDLSESLEQQTATSEILRVISGSPTDVQPVFDAIARSAVQLCEASFGSVFRFDGELLHMTANQGLAPDELQAALRLFPMRMTPRGIGVLAAVRERRIVHIPDIRTDPEWQAPYVRQTLGPVAGYRSFLAVPLLRDDVCLGLINVWRREPEPFSDKQISLLQTFADQAVIAIENVRLFKELENRNAALTEALDQQTATGEILGVISSSPTDLQPVFDTILHSATSLCEAQLGAMFTYDGELLHPGAVRTDLPAPPAHWTTPYRPTPASGVGRALATGQPIHIADIASDPAYVAGDPLRVRAVEDLHARTCLWVPLLKHGQPLGVLTIYRREVRPFTDKQIALLKTFADQAVIAIENVRLFREIEDKSRQLEAANRHKDEFLASMSHELRTPLNAVIGFSEVLLERMFGEVNPKQEEYLNDILASGRHLLSLINDILDLAKIEAGRMELDLEEFDLAAAIDNALVLVRERATRKGLALDTRLDARLGSVRGDQRKIKQVLLNLLSNAVKFTPEGGRIEVRGQRVDGHAEIAVSDTGIGIAAEDQEAVFEEFRQVGTDYTKKHEGTGLGLTLSRKFVELHGGRIWVKSQPGAGSTFTFTIPVSAWPTS